MKKLVLTLTAFAALASCSKDSIVEQATYAPIAFDNTFVDNSTRLPYDASYKTATLQSFEVYGTITNSSGASANIFAAELVSKNLTIAGTGDVWKYDAANTQYWIPGNTYNFTAIADGNVAGATEVTTGDYGMPTAINLLDASAQHDILYAKATERNFKLNDVVAPVEFTFDHLLAKAKFTVKNTIDTDSGYSYKVSDITIKGTTANGVYDIDSGEWSAADKPATYDLEFGNAVATATAEGAEADFIGFNQSLQSNYERLIIPTLAEDDDQKTTVNVSFTRDYYYNEVAIRSEVNTLSVDAQLVAGRAYNFVLKLGNPGEPIEFTVSEITDWEYDHDGYNPGVDVK